MISHGDFDRLLIGCIFQSLSFILLGLNVLFFVLEPLYLSPVPTPSVPPKSVLVVNQSHFGVDFVPFPISALRISTGFFVWNEERKNVPF